MRSLLNKLKALSRKKGEFSLNPLIDQIDYVYGGITGIYESGKKAADRISVSRAKLRLKKRKPVLNLKNYRFICSAVMNCCHFP